MLPKSWSRGGNLVPRKPTARPNPINRNPKSPAGPVSLRRHEGVIFLFAELVTAIPFAPTSIAFHSPPAEIRYEVNFSFPPSAEHL